LELWVHAPIEELRKRDPKGLYRLEAEGRLGDLSGSRGPYEPPENPELDLDTSAMTVEEAVEVILARLVQDGLVPPG
jgi:adenylylsulfate kinase-like enzyme